MRLFAFLLLLNGLVSGQTKPLLISQLAPWQQVARASGTIFSGVVLQVQRSGTGPGTTQITFRVENAMRGVRRGQILKISEWGGLWDVGERYVKGEHVLLFLYPKSKLGLTSPVGGRSGRYEVDAAGQVLIGDPTRDALRSFPVRAVRAQVRRSGGE